MERQTIPVAREEAVVRTRSRVTGRVLVKRRIAEDEVLLDALDARETVSIERVPIGRAVDGPQPVREENGVLVVPVVEEIAFVQRRYVLKEEVRVVRRRVEKKRPVRARVRRDVVTVERAEAPASAARGHRDDKGGSA